MQEIKRKKHNMHKGFTLMIVPNLGASIKNVKIPFWIVYAIMFMLVVVVSAIIILAAYTAKYTRIVAANKNELNIIIESYNQKLQAALLANQELQNENLHYKNSLEEVTANADKSVALIEKDRDIEINNYFEKINTLNANVNELKEFRNNFVDIYNKAKIIFAPNLPLLEKYTTSQSISLVFPTENKPTLYAVFASLEKNIGYANESFNSVNLTDIKSPLEKYESAYPSIWPAKGRVSTEMGTRTNPFTNQGSEKHEGMDIAVNTGTNVLATANGVVSFAGDNGGYGKFIIIDHGYGIQTCYGHNSKLLVKESDIVHRGDVIAQSGNTGRSTGPHLHYEVRLNGEKVNPRGFLFDTNKEDKNV